MTTYCGTYGGNPFSKFFILLIVVAIAIGSILVLGEHSLKHSLVEDVRNCPSDNIGIKARNPLTGRFMFLCEVEKDQWGRIVAEKENGLLKEVTAFLNKEARKNTLAYSLRNMVNQGYTDVIYVKDILHPEIAKILANLIP